MTVIPRTARDEFVVLACDGIWDVMSNEDVCCVVREQKKEVEDLSTITGHILDTCLNLVRNILQYM